MTTRADPAAQPAAVDCPTSLCIPHDRCGAPATDETTNTRHLCSGFPHYGDHSCPCGFTWSGAEASPAELRKVVDEVVRVHGMAFTVGDQVLDPGQVVLHGAETLTEYGQLTSGGGVHVRNPAISHLVPLAEWIAAHQIGGGKVMRRRVIVVEDWEEVTEP